MTRIMIEIGDEATVSTNSQPTNTAAVVPALQGSDAFAGAVNAGSAPDLSSDGAPHLYIASPSAPSAGLPDMVSAGPAPASVFQMSDGGLA